MGIIFATVIVILSMSMLTIGTVIAAVFGWKSRRTGFWRMIIWTLGVGLIASMLSMAVAGLLFAGEVAGEDPKFAGQMAAIFAVLAVPLVPFYLAVAALFWGLGRWRSKGDLE